MRQQLMAAALLCATSVMAEPITINGQVTGKDGKPVAKCEVYFNKQMWVADDSIKVSCDADGGYQAQIEPGLYNSMYVCDGDKYGKTALEFWGWNLTLTESQTIDAAYDRLEVFSLATWSSNGGSNSIFASFRPMSLKQPEFKTVEHQGKPMGVIDITPTIDASSLQASIDGEPLELRTFDWTYEKVNNCKGFPEAHQSPHGCLMPMIIAQFTKPKLAAGQHLFKLRLVDAANGDLGEGITHFSSNQSGFGF